MKIESSNQSSIAKVQQEMDLCQYHMGMYIHIKHEFETENERRRDKMRCDGNDTYL